MHCALHLLKLFQSLIIFSFFIEIICKKKPLKPQCASMYRLVPTRYKLIHFLNIFHNLLAAPFLKISGGDIYSVGRGVRTKCGMSRRKMSIVLTQALLNIKGGGDSERK